MKDTVMKILKYILLIAVTVLFLFPVIYMLACSFMTGSQVSEMLNFSDGKYKELNMIPNMATLEQFYQTLFRKPEYLLKFWNSVVCTFPTVIGQAAVSSLAAFAFAKLKFPFRDKLFFIYIILLILPLQVTLVPDYMILENMNLLNNFLSVILPGTFSAFGICLLRQSIKYIPDSAIEAARVDGASYLKIFTNIILPQIKGGLITLALLCFIDNWNVVEQPLIYFDNEGMYPLSVTLTDVGSSDYGIIFACGVIFMIPALLIYLYGHRILIHRLSELIRDRREAFMKKDKLKSVVLKFSIVFFIVIALLTYFSKTINNMLLPKVKVVSVQTGVIDDTAGSNDMKTHYLLPVSSVDGAGNTGIVFVINKTENGDATVEEVSVDICNSDELYCEVTSDSLFGDSQVVYKTTKSIENGSSVYIEEETV